MRALAVLALLFALAGCAASQPGAKNPLIRASYEAADRLADMGGAMVPDQPVIVATLVNIDKLTESSTFGRVLAEQVATRLLGRGYPVIELKLRGSVFVREGTGELLLSREVKDISSAHNAQAVVVGSYAVGADKIYLNLKLVRPTDNRVLAADDVAIDLDETTRALLLSEPS
ncbi:FlgO family outer membrane protein [Chitinimonas koreensis]|uniref:FlgO family outer membrane protein n=1 Tax=Chitinimonas koreensis TaxID=356302 RepID=UPI00041C4582|nr:FlgO family outer membrane protein [Chitinimonas koreensis]QNM98332.1 hypothetical protein H9L41_08895 [Chitinimonas koreensis]